MCRSLRVDGNIGRSKLSLIIIAKKKTKIFEEFADSGPSFSDLSEYFYTMHRVPRYEIESRTREMIQNSSTVL